MKFAYELLNADGRLERGHDPEAIGLSQRHQAHGDRNLAVHSGSEEGEQRLVQRHAMRSGHGADGDGVGAGLG